MYQNLISGRAVLMAVASACLLACAQQPVVATGEAQAKPDNGNLTVEFIAHKTHCDSLLANRVGLESGKESSIQPKDEEATEAYLKLLVKAATYEQRVDIYRAVFASCNGKRQMFEGVKN